MAIDYSGYYSFRSKMRAKKKSIFGIKDLGLKYLVEEVKLLYKVPASEDNIEIDEDIRKTKWKDSKRRSGQPKYIHPYRVACSLYKNGCDKKDIIVGLFHDILEDTEYKEEDIKIILESYVKIYLKLNEKDTTSFIEEVLDAVNRLTKKEIKKPKIPTLKLKSNIVINNLIIKGIKEEDREKGYIEENVNGHTIRIYLYYYEKANLNSTIEIPYRNISHTTYSDKKKGYIIIGKKVERIVSISLKDDDFQEDSLTACEKYEKDLEIYHKKMQEYIAEIGKSKIAKRVKIQDRIDNLKDFADDDDSDWIKDYIEETEMYYVPLAEGTGLEEELRFAIELAKQTQKVKEWHEKNDYRPLSIQNNQSTVR